MPTVAVIVIGDEILSGKFADENGPYAIARLRALGADLRRIAVIADDVATIADEVRRCALAFDVVITSGGVGPTHDDVTFEGVAAAFSLPLAISEPILRLFDAYGLPRNEGTLRMANIPSGADLLALDEQAARRNATPVIRVNNVFVLPGVPRLFQSKFEAIAERFQGIGRLTHRLYTLHPEWEIAEKLTAVAARYPSVALGSYPRFGGTPPFFVMVTVESHDAPAFEAARKELLAFLSDSLDGIIPSSAG